MSTQWDGKHQYWCGYEGKCSCEADWLKAKMVKLRSLTARAYKIMKSRLAEDGCADADTLEWLEEYKKL